MSYPVSEVARVIGAVARGNLSQSMNPEVDGRPVRGEYLRISTVVNTMVDQLASFASEVTRVAREVGTEGKLGGQAHVEGVAGTWKDLTDSVNHMAANLTGQVRNIAEVTTAVASGNLSKKITVDVKGEILELKNTINTMVDQLNSLRLRSDARGARSRHRRQARRPGESAKASPAPGKTSPTTSITWPRTSPARCATSPKSPPRSRAAICPRRSRSTCKGEILELKNTVNTMVDQLNSLRLRSDARRARSRHRRQARRPGESGRRRRHLEGPHRQRQLTWPRTSPARCATSPKS